MRRGDASRLIALVARPRRGRVAAAVCCRWEDDAVRLCLVRTSDGDRWTFPKGHRELGETLAAAAAREALEEAGVVGVVDERCLGIYRHPSRRGRDALVAAFMLHVTATTVPHETFRTQVWCDPQDARGRLAVGRDPFHAGELHRMLDRAVLEAAASRQRGLEGGSPARGWQVLRRIRQQSS